MRDLVTALAYRKTGREAEGEKLLKAWLDQDPTNKLAKWAHDAFNGNVGDTKLENDEYRVVRAVVEL